MNDITEFFNKYQKANEVFDIHKIGVCYGEIFLFGQPQGVQAVNKAAFLTVLPKRKGFFQTIGLQASKVHSIETKDLDSHYVEAQVEWEMHFEKGEIKFTNITKATYILYKQNESYEIVVQIDHQDLMERVKELGLM